MIRLLETLSLGFKFRSALSKDSLGFEFELGV